MHLRHWQLFLMHLCPSLNLFHPGLQFGDAKPPSAVFQPFSFLRRKILHSRTLKRSFCPFSAMPSFPAAIYGNQEPILAFRALHLKQSLGNLRQKLRIFPEGTGMTGIIHFLPFHQARHLLHLCHSALSFHL